MAWSSEGTGNGGGDGKSAYQIWLDNGNVGDEQVFLNSLKGQKGDTGAPGTALDYRPWPSSVTRVFDVVDPGAYHLPFNIITDIPSTIQSSANYLVVMGFNNASKIYLLLSSLAQNPLYIGYKLSSGSTTVSWRRLPPDRTTDKKLVLMGDSVTSSIGRVSIQDKTGLTTTNLAKSGSSIADRNPAQAAEQSDWSLCNRSKADGAQSIPIEDFDFGIIFMGTNDFGNDHPLGTIDSVDEFTILGALNVSIQNFISRNPKIKLLISTPLYRHDSDNPARLHSLKEVCDGIVEVAKKYGIPVINAYERGGVNAYNKDTFLSDGLHLTTFGQTHVNDLLSTFVITNI